MVDERNDISEEETFINPRTLDCRDNPILLVVTCSRCGCLVVDRTTHLMFHLKHGHSGYGFDSLRTL